ncbi:MAG: hypothetical protein SGJ20_19775 [Planctomycetota bacterium]|nr:hypothetical protein [Planctomycetota bacterium]
MTTTAAIRSTERRTIYLPAVILLALILPMLLTDLAIAQLLRRRLLAPPPAEANSIAITGQPFGVGSITVQMPPDARNGLFNERGFTLVEKNGRAFYATFDSKPVRALLREVLNRPQSVTAYFLFTGQEPLELDLYAPTGVRKVIVPVAGAAQHAALLNTWWTSYSTAAQTAAKDREYPPLVDNYLVSMLSRRLSLAPVEARPGLLSQFNQPQVDQAVGVLLGSESARQRLIQEIMASTATAAEPANEPMPIAAVRPELIFPAVPKDIAIEPIAMHVPVECLYVRFGSFTNYQWFRGVLDDFGGDMRNLIAARAVSFNINDRIQQQLALRENALAKILGPKVIADVAMIGNDPFMREGASIGMLFQAHSNFALSSDFKSQRAAALKANADATEKTEAIAGQQVSFLSTPDNRIRSFYAVAGDFHLVTTSRHLVKRFIEASADPAQSLGGSGEFRFARQRMPLDRQDTVFAYLSAQFFNTLASPQYRVEMNRRLRSIAEMQIFKLATLAAKNEHRPTTFAAMTEAGLIPASLGLRADGSKLVLTDNGQLVDSQRGPIGTFMPISDMPVTKITRSELEDYRQFEQLYVDQLQQLDPMFFAVKRYAGGAPDIERVVLDASVSPMADKHVAKLSEYLGPATTERMAPIVGNLITLEAFSKYQTVEPTHLYFGLQNIPSRFAFDDGALALLGALQSLKYYYGGWPSAGPLQRMGIRDDLPVNADGFGRATVSLYQRTLPPFITGSTDFDLLANVTSQMRIVPARRPGQLWLNVGDLLHSDLAKLINTYGYFRARQITGGNLHFLHSLTSQLGVPADQALNTADEVLEGRLLCPLGGELKLERRPGELPNWVSTAWTSDTGRLLTSAPPTFITPPLGWFRGLDLDLWLEGNELSLHSEIDMQRLPGHATTKADEAAAAAITTTPATPATDAGSVLPKFPFDGFNLFGSTKKSDPGKPDEKNDGKRTEKPDSDQKNSDTTNDSSTPDRPRRQVPPPPRPDNPASTPEELPVP